MNRAKVIALCHKVAENTGLSFNAVLLCYFLENLLLRIKNPCINVAICGTYTYLDGKGKEGEWQ